MSIRIINIAISIALSATIIICNGQPNRNTLSKDKITIQIVAPIQIIDKDTIKNHMEIFDKLTHLHLIITNISQDPVTIWKPTFKLGFKAISFQIKFPSGKVFNIYHKSDLLFLTNDPPEEITLAKDESTVINAALGDTNVCKDVPLEQFKIYKIVKIRAIYENDIGSYGFFKNIWCGKVFSKWYEYAIKNNINDRARIRNTIYY
jgi:hypothetical protein